MATNPAKARATTSKPRAVKPAPVVPVAPSSPPAPVAPPAPATAPAPAIMVTGPSTGFRRAGLLFGSEPRELGVAELGDEIEARGRLLAIINEPRLIVRLHLPDGTVRPFSAEEIEVLDLLVGGVPESQLDRACVALIAQLTTAD